MGEGRRSRGPQRKLSQREMEDAATRMALGTPEIRGQIEALSLCQSIELKFDNDRTGFARRTLVLKVTLRGQGPVRAAARVSTRVSAEQSVLLTCPVGARGFLSKFNGRVGFVYSRPP
jgi:hypothetical protein